MSTEPRPWRARAAARRRAALVLAAVSAVAVLLLAGAYLTNDQPNSGGQLPPATRNPPHQDVRHDLDDLVRRFPGLGTPVEAAWQVGTIGDNRIPPIIYWIDAVATLTPQTAADLRARPDLTPADPPTVTEDLREFVPAGDWQTAFHLGNDLSSYGWGSQAYIATSTDTVVITAQGRDENPPTIG